MLQREPLKEKLSGLLVEYRVLLLYSRDAGQREASLSFHIGAGLRILDFAMRFRFCLTANQRLL